MKKRIISAALITTMLMGNVPAVYAMSNQGGLTEGELTWNALQFEEAYASFTNQMVSVTPFTLHNSSRFADYQEQFQVKGIKSYRNNGGQYSSSALAKAFDGDLTTHWETGRPNSNSFTNEVVVTFEQMETINRIVYGARTDASNKGHVTEFSIYSSKSETGDNFELVANGTAEKNSGLTQFQFESIECQRIKFVFDAANSDWASAREFWFFEEDVVLDQVDHIFTNGLMNELTEEYQDAAKREELLQQFESHPMKDSYQGVLDTMISIGNGEVIAQEDIIVMPQKGHEVAERNRTQLNIAMYAHEATGVFIRPGETLQVYVDADANGILPEIVFANNHFQTLKAGYNEIKLPEKYKNPAQIYLANRAYPDQQAYQPSIRVVGGTQYPCYVHGKTDPVEFYEMLTEYAATVTLEGVQSGEGNPNMADLFSDNIQVQTSAKGAYLGLTTQLNNTNQYADYTMEVYEDMYREYVEYSGFDYDVVEGREWNLRPLGKFMLVGSDAGPFGWAQHGFTGYNGGGGLKNDSFWVSLVQASIVENGGWTLFHEVAHQYDSGTLGTGESTNNLYSFMMQDLYIENNRMVQENRWEKHFTNYHNTKQYPDDQLFLGAITYQLEGIYGTNIYGDAQRISRENNNNWLNGMNNKQRHAVAISMALGLNVLPHYEYYGIEMNERAHSLVADLPVIEIKSYYANDKIFASDATAFDNKDVKPVIHASGSGQITLTMSIEEEDNALLVYELYRDGEYLGVTYSNTFVDKTAVPGVEHIYTVKAYDRKLNVSIESDPVSKNASEPKLAVTGEIVLPIHSEFEPLEYIRAKDVDGNDITNRVNVLDNTVNTGVKGEYTVVYQVADKDGNSSTIQTAVQVVADVTYVSDLTPNKYTGFYKKDVDHNGNTICLVDELGEVEYTKGIGAHANSTITYQLNENEYDFFEAYIGLDDAVRNRTGASVTFEVYADGEKVYESGVMKAAHSKKHVKVSLEGVNELKLVTTDAGNGNSYDHAMWADAKLVMESAAPVLNIPKNDAVQVGETIDNLFGAYSATDIEDGDLTSKVTVDGQVNVNQPGKYDITYSVVDTEGNKTTAVRTIAVVDMRDSTFVSDYTWNTASCGWGSIRKDLSPSGNAIRLTNEANQEVVFEKGLGTHATSRVKYDLTNIDAEYFSAYVGVDRAMYNSVASVAFEVWVDGEKVVQTPVLRGKDAMQYLEVKVAGAKELILVATDGGNGNGSDHAVWGDAKFHYANPERITINTNDLQSVVAELEALELNKYTVESVTAVQAALEQAKNLLSEVASQVVTQAQVDEMTSTLVRVKNSVQISQAKLALAAVLEEAYDAKYDQYTDHLMWNDYVYTREVYRENLESITMFTEQQIQVMVGFMRTCMEMLEM